MAPMQASRMQGAKSSVNWTVLLPIILLTAMFVMELQSVKFTRNMATADKAEVAKPPLLKTAATLCQREVAPEHYKSQSEEDVILLRWFKNLCGGTYIEMGGLNGIKYSNSHVFNKGLDWKGVLVEADPRNYRALVTNRPNEIANIHVGVCLDEQDLHYVKGQRSRAVSGFLEFASEDFKKEYWTQEMIDNAIIVRCRRLDKILHEAVGHSFHFDFFSLDIEGAELLALQSLNFDEFQFGMILVEADGTNERKDQSIKAILDRAGYDFFGTINRSNWFVNRNFDRIYEDVIY